MRYLPPFPPLVIALVAALSVACRDATGVERSPVNLVFVRAPYDTLFVADPGSGSIEQRIALSKPASRFGFSPLGDRLAVVSAGALWLMNPDGSSAVQLASSVGNFAWAPDGKRIAYIQDASHEIHLIGVDGLNDTVLPRATPGGFDGIAWSPDGTHIAFEGPGPSTPRTVYIVNLDGSGLRDIELTLPGPSLRASGEPTWSPDGRQLAIARDLIMPDGTHETNLWIVTLATNDARRITTGIAADGRPAWSPDGRQIAFLRFAGNDVDVFVVGPDGSGLRQITQTPDREEAPHYWHWPLT